MTGRFKRELVEIRERVATKKALHLQQIEEVKQEMANREPETVEQIIDHYTKKPLDTHQPVMSPAGFAMTIRLDKNIKPILKNNKD